MGKELKDIAAWTTKKTFQVKLRYQQVVFSKEHNYLMSDTKKKRNHAWILEMLVDMEDRGEFCTKTPKKLSHKNVQPQVSTEMPNTKTLKTIAFINVTSN